MPLGLLGRVDEFLQVLVGKRQDGDVLELSISEVIDPAGAGHCLRGHGGGNAKVTVDSTTRPRSRSSRCSPGAEFMAEEPVKPKGRGRKPQSATLSMFEWALTLE